MFVDRLVAMFVAPGRGAYAGDDPELHRPRIAFEVHLGQCVTVVDGPEFLGWASWFRVDDETLGSIARGEMDDWVRRWYFPDVVSGVHCYIGDVVVAPQAPPTIYRLLIDLVGGCNVNAESLSGHMLKRNGRERFAIRYNDGRPAWWRRRQNAGWMH